MGRKQHRKHREAVSYSAGAGASELAELLDKVVVVRHLCERWRRGERVSRNEILSATDEYSANCSCEVLENVTSMFAVAPNKVWLCFYLPKVTYVLEGLAFGAGS